MHRHASLLALLLAVAPAHGRADESPPDLELVLRTRLEEAARVQRWDDVVATFQQLRAQGLAANEPRLLVRYAEAQAARGDAAAAEAALLEVLGRRPDHVEALPLLARLRARAGQTAQASDLLLAAARAGRLVLRDLAAEPEASPLRLLLRRPDFVLGALRAARGEELTATAPHDPFVSALVRDEDATAGEEKRDDRLDLAALRADLDALFARLLERARADDLPAVERLMGELDALLRRLAPAVAEEELRAAQARLGEAAEVLAAARLRVLVRQGNADLRRAGGARRRALGRRAGRGRGPRGPRPAARGRRPRRRAPRGRPGRRAGARDRRARPHGPDDRGAAPRRHGDRPPAAGRAAQGDRQRPRARRGRAHRRPAHGRGARGPGRRGRDPLGRALQLPGRRVRPPPPVPSVSRAAGRLPPARPPRPSATLPAPCRSGLIGPVKPDGRPALIEFHTGALTPSGGEPGRLLGAMTLGLVATVGFWSAFLTGSQHDGLLGLGALALGAYSVLARRDVVIDRAEGAVFSTFSLQPVTLRRRRYALDRVTGVTVEIPPRGHRQTETRYVITLLIDGERPLRLETVTDPRTARTECERVARFCGVEADLPPALA
ncbi:MAG: hypothetical protein KF878_11265 [Planctomycetes bacterium]|nr:hypothetical protein [Planctomycetota bacterium]